MNTKELITAEIDNLSEEELDEIYNLIKLFRAFTETKSTSSRQSAMSRLREIKIHGPRDFATNLDLYLNGEKHEEPNPS
jgi:hypothetical protein